MLRLCGNDKEGHFIFTDTNDMEHKLDVQENLCEIITTTAGCLLKCTVDQRMIIHIEICEYDTDDDQ